MVELEPNGLTLLSSYGKRNRLLNFIDYIDDIFYSYPTETSEILENFGTVDIAHMKNQLIEKFDIKLREFERVEYDS